MRNKIFLLTAGVLAFSCLSSRAETAMPEVVVVDLSKDMSVLQPVKELNIEIFAIADLAVLKEEAGSDILELPNVSGDRVNEPIKKVQVKTPVDLDERWWSPAANILNITDFDVFHKRPPNPVSRE